jgi:hypothetical protein
MACSRSKAAAAAAATEVEAESGDKVVKEVVSASELTGPTHTLPCRLFRHTSCHQDKPTS